MKNDIIFGKQRDEEYSNGWSCNRGNLTENSAMRKWRTTFSNGSGKEIELALDKYNGNLHLKINVKSGSPEEKSKEATLPLNDRTIGQFSKFALEQFGIAPSIFATTTSQATQELQTFLKDTIREEIGFISTNVAPRVQYDNGPERNNSCVIGFVS